MRHTVTGKQMKEIDRDTIERIGIPSLVLMERAALAVADEAWKQGGPGLRVLSVCGTGNNGADGIAAGRILQGRGCQVTVLLAGNPEHETAEHKQQQAIARALGVSFARYGDFVPGDYDVILDAIFGIGLAREISGAYRELVEMLKKMAEGGSRVIGVDTPSGINGQTGAVMGIALPAETTVTFGYEKTGLLLEPGRSYAGRLVTADIGFSDLSLRRCGYDCLVPEPMDLHRLPARKADGNKGSFGKLLMIAGSGGMSGACFLSALAAYRTGAGLVKVLTVPENREILQVQLPEAIVETYDPKDLMEEASQSFVESQCSWADGIVLGPGLGREPYAEYLTEAVLSHAYVPVVLDADGLNAVAANPYLTRYFTENIIITPHMGEMARLCACQVRDLKADPVKAARDYSSRYGVVCVLKDAVTVTADKEGNAYVNSSGCSAMAKAGSGDVLTGVIGGLLARGMDCVDAAVFGVYLHGRAGESAAADRGENGVLARDTANHLSAQWTE